MTDKQTLKLALEAHQAMREWIDAVPDDTVLPTMPGCDGDWLDTVEANLKQALATPVQRPVAMPENWFAGMPEEYRKEAWRVATPPAAQRQWTGLTDEEWDEFSDKYGMIIFGRLKQEIEAKLRSKNNG